MVKILIDSGDSSSRFTWLNALFSFLLPSTFMM